MNSTTQPAHRADPELRFAFGRNWKSFLATLDDHGIKEAHKRSCESLGRNYFRSLRKLADACGYRFRSGLALYDGDAVLPFGDRLCAAPVSSLGAAAST